MRKISIICRKNWSFPYVFLFVDDVVIPFFFACFIVIYRDSRGLIDEIFLFIQIGHRDSQERETFIIYVYIARLIELDDRRHNNNHTHSHTHKLCAPFHFQREFKWSFYNMSILGACELNVYLCFFPSANDQSDENFIFFSL